MGTSLYDELSPVAVLAAKQYGLPPELLLRLIMQESGFDSDVVFGRRDSSAGAKGAGQFMDATAAELGIDPLDPIQALFGAAQYLRQNIDYFGGDVVAGTAAYNAGPGTVERLRTAYGDQWIAHLPTETKTYLTNIQPATAGVPAVGGYSSPPLSPGGQTMPEDDKKDPDTGLGSGDFGDDEGNGKAPRYIPIAGYDGVAKDTRTNIYYRLPPGPRDGPTVGTPERVSIGEGVAKLPLGATPMSRAETDRMGITTASAASQPKVIPPGARWETIGNTQYLFAPGSREPLDQRDLPLGEAAGPPQPGANINSLLWAHGQGLLNDKELAEALRGELLGSPTSVNLGIEFNQIQSLLDQGMITPAEAKGRFRDIALGKEKAPPGLTPVPGYEGRFLTPGGSVADLRDKPEREEPFSPDTLKRLRGILGYTGGILEPVGIGVPMVETSQGTAEFSSGRVGRGGGYSGKTLEQQRAELDLYALHSGRYIPGLSEAVSGPGGYLTQPLGTLTQGVQQLPAYANARVQPQGAPPGTMGLSPEQVGQPGVQDFMAQRQQQNFALAGGQLTPEEFLRRHKLKPVAEEEPVSA